MREKLIAHDVVECVLGLGLNLLYNSPIEACVVIYRMKKPKAQRNKVFFINAMSRVMRKQAQNFLTDERIQRIEDAYRAFADEDGFTRVVSNDEIPEKSSNLSIPLYVRTKNGNGNGSGADEDISLKQAIADWQRSSTASRDSMSTLVCDTGRGLDGN